MLKKKFLSFPDRIYNPYTPLMRKTDVKHGNALMSERLEIQSLLGWCVLDTKTRYVFRKCLD